MAKMSLRGFYNLIEAKTYVRCNASAEYIFNAIISELNRNNLNCSTSIERAPYRFKHMESDGKVLFISERGLFTLFVTVCAVGDYTQVQIITRNVARRYSFEDANHSLEHSMHNLYKNAVNMCICNTIDHLAEVNKWSQVNSETSEMEVQ